MPKKKQIYATPHILSDLPLEQSDTAYFHFEEFAVTLARLIASKETRTPVTIGVSGAWGSGKTTLLRRIQKMLDQTAMLNAQPKPSKSSWGSGKTTLLRPIQKMLDQTAVHGAQTKPSKLDFANADENPQVKFRVCKTVWFNAWKYADEDQLLVALVRVIVQAMAEDDVVSKVIGKLLDPSYPRRDVVNTVLSWFSINIGAATVGLNTGVPAPTSFAEKTAMLDLFDDAFNKLMAAWVHRKLDVDRINPEEGVLVVFIDDLDRCLPEKAVQVLEAVKIFLDKPGCIFVLGAHTDVVQQAVANYYQDSGVVGESAREYLEKIIQLRFDLPPIVTDMMKNYLTVEKVGDELQKNWQVLVIGAELNLRKVKTFVNDLNLQWAVLQNIGQAEGVVRDDFTKWQVLMRAAPDNFKKRIFDIDDLELRLKFVQDVLKWGNGSGDETLIKEFQEYEPSLRLRRVLREIKAFSGAFDADTLDAFVHLEAPSPKPVKETFPPERPERKAAEGEAGVGGILPVESIRTAVPFPTEAERAAGEGTRIAVMGQTVSENHLTIGGFEFVKIPAGKFIMGSKEENNYHYSDESPQHTLVLSEFWIAKFPVTNEQYTGYGKVKHPVPDWENKKDHPAVNISQDDALAFCKWFNTMYAGELQKLGLAAHLPTEAQWEKAARGEYGNEWPWGNKFDLNRCNSLEGKMGDTTPVGRYSPQGDSPYGCADMVGNVWEWTHTLSSAYPYRADDGRENEEDTGFRMLRGGSFRDSCEAVRCEMRSNGGPTFWSDNIGFRIAISQEFLS